RPAARLRVLISLSGRKRLQRASSSASWLRAAASAPLGAPTASSSTWVPMAGTRQPATLWWVSRGRYWRGVGGPEVLGLDAVMVLVVSWGGCWCAVSGVSAG